MAKVSAAAWFSSLVGCLATVYVVLTDFQHGQRMADSMAQPNSQRFAWDGVAFSVPPTWELSSHNLSGGVMRIAMEDTISTCLEMDWIRPPRRVDAAAVRRRYLRLAEPFVATAEYVEEVSGLPEEWSAFRYQMGDARCLVLATFSAAVDGGPVCFVKVHGQGDSECEPDTACRLLATTFNHSESGLREWRFYDVHLRVDARFRLVGTALQAGRKFLQFQWRLRRLFVWVFSLADMVLRDHDLATWCTAYLNGFRGIRGRRFEVTGEGTIQATRPWYHPIGHSEEIGRLCWRYRVGFDHLRERNQIVLWVFHYRGENDIKHLDSGFDPRPDAGPRSTNGKQRE